MNIACLRLDLHRIDMPWPNNVVLGPQGTRKFWFYWLLLLGFGFVWVFFAFVLVFFAWSGKREVGAVILVYNI